MLLLYSIIIDKTRKIKMWINKIKNFLLDIFFPKICLGCQKNGFFICPTCLKNIIVLGEIKNNFQGFKGMIACFDYHQPLIKKMIKRAKYSPYQKELIPILTSFLIKFLKNFPQILSFWKKNNFVLIPIPLTKGKMAWRGFNQAEIIAKEINLKLNLPLNKKIIKRIKNKKSQTNLGRKNRMENVKGIFKIEEKSPKNIILIDDVLTTGATLEEAKKTLVRAGAKNVWAIVLAKG